jgi:hypothetical protein
MVEEPNAQLLLADLEMMHDADDVVVLCHREQKARQALENFNICQS